VKAISLPVFNVEPGKYLDRKGLPQATRSAGN
jgi:hypothetical protein